MAAGEIAERLQISPQTLRRKLREEDTSLRQIRERMLRDAAIASLTTGAETVAALSQRLGFSEPSAFIRAFRRWTGTSPGTYRRTCVR
jgi:AraC-like DNA-binding protein